MKQVKFYISLGLGILTVAGCNSGSNSAASTNNTQVAQTLKANAVSVNAATANPCLTGSLSLADPSNQWYSAATLNIKNSCATEQGLAKNTTITWTSQDLSGAAVVVNTTLGLVPGWSPTMEFTTSSDIVTGTLSGSLSIPANGTAIYGSGGINMNGTAYNNALANSTISIGSFAPAPVAQYGKLNIIFDASGVCSSGCESTSVTITNSSNQIVKSFSFSNWNASSTIQIESLSADQYTVTVANSNNYSALANPNPTVVQVNTISTTKVNFSVLSSSGTVAGWPSYIAMGTITNNGYFVGANSENGLDHPTDAIFKYAGSNGAGDIGFILFPQTISRTILEAEYYSESTNHLSRPVMVEYTLQLSGGGNVLPDLAPENMAFHFINLATDAAFLEADGTNGKKYSTYGSIVLNPDALGFIQQQGFDGSNPNSGLNLKTATYPVNQEIARAVCYLTTKVSYSWTFSNTGQTINYTGTPIEIAKAITNQANGAWVMGDTYSDWSDNAAPAWYAACKSNPTNPQHINIPTFANNFSGWIQANNWLIKQFGPHVKFGWHENVSMLPSGSKWIHQYNAYNGSTPTNIQEFVTSPTVAVLNEFGVFNGTYKPDFIVFDRYEVDDTENLSFFYNDSDWSNLFTMVGQVSKGLNNLPVMLWQMPGGHMQVTNDIDTRDITLTVGGVVHGHGGSLTDYLFGDSNLHLGSICGTSNLQSYWCSLGNITSTDYAPFTGAVYLYLTMNGYKWNQYNNKLTTAAQSNVFAILWGGGTGPTTGINHLVAGDNDNGWLAGKIVKYYANPQPTGTN